MTADVSVNPNHKNRLDFEINVPSELWEQTGEAGDRRARLYLGGIFINGVAFHTEAIAVHVDETGTQVVDDDAWEQTFNDNCSGAGTEGHLQTITIQGREYAVFLSPFCD